eukprot:CAMPEP_0167741456 /NCGR_PEP_ID=MMETSP0110_2-20121227/868_1 /TAXON_ID=629695 /ORGANISM="Gymnochlora sp., Strain CCMP2014" /LENGTH=118 /DNA_ID=CAMNT_0007625513 /DNA_START=210 /DNA_END=563 /DNA_ORIENTATION=+
MEKKKDKNPEGFWELQRVFKLNWAYLHLQGIYGLNYFAKNRFQIENSVLRSLQEEARSIMKAFSAAAGLEKSWVLKALRLELSHPLWTDIKEMQPDNVVIVMPFRSPTEVVASTWNMW